MAYRKWMLATALGLAVAIGLFMARPADTLTYTWGQHVLKFPAPQDCDGVTRNLWFVPPLNIDVRKVTVWTGTNAGVPFPSVDVHTTVAASHQMTGFVLAVLGIDRYAPPSGLHQVTEDWAIPVRVPYGGNISVEHSCQHMGVYSQSQVFVVISYTM